MDAIVRFYFERVKNGRMELSAVPKKWRDAVAAALEG